MFSWYKYLIGGLVVSHLGFWSGNLFLIALFPDLCIFVLFFLSKRTIFTERNNNIICTMDDVRGDFLGTPHYTTPAKVIANEI